MTSECDIDPCSIDLVHARDTASSGEHLYEVSLKLLYAYRRYAPDKKHTPARPSVHLPGGNYNTTRFLLNGRIKI
jgi:hypothetical protein